MAKRKGKTNCRPKICVRMSEEELHEEQLLEEEFRELMDDMKERGYCGGLAVRMYEVLMREFVDESCHDLFFASKALYYLMENGGC